MYVQRPNSGNTRSVAERMVTRIMIICGKLDWVHWARLYNIQVPTYNVIDFYAPEQFITLFH